MNHCRGIILLLIGFLLPGLVIAQVVEIRGTVADSAGTAMPGATVKLITGKDTSSIATDKQGLFSFSLPTANSFKISISSIGYVPYQQTFPAGTKDVGVIKMQNDATLLGEIVVKSTIPIVIKEDTVQYNANAYKVREGAPVEDVIKKLPDVTVGADGKITAQGKPVSRVRVNGKDFFGGDVQAATQNLPADIIENIQIIDDYGDQANLTGIKSGDPEKIININIQKEKNRGNFGSATVAGGTEGRYAAGLIGNVFRDEQQVSFLGAINNTNSNLFNFNGGGRGGGARGANFGGNERGGGGNGITLSRSAGINFRDQWGTKISVNGSYSFSARDNTTQSTTFQQDINPLNIRSTNRISNGHSKSMNHRLTWNMEYRMDTMNFFRIAPYVSLSSSESGNSGQSEISRPGYFTFNTNQSSNESRAPNAGTDFVFNHKFRKKGRNINLFASIDYSYRDQNTDTKSTYANDDSTGTTIVHTDTTQQQAIDVVNRNLRTNARFSYTEPISGGTRPMYLELNYEWTNSNTRNVREVNDIDPLNGKETFNTVQSNHFDYQFTTNRIGLNLKGSGPKYNYVVGIISQPSTLKGQSVGKDINTNYYNSNWIPSARFVYNFARSHSLTATLGGSSREPGFMQLQPVIDSSNLNNIVVGNPDLQAELTRRLGLQYNKFDSKSGRSMFANISFDQTQNKIVTNRINNPSGTGRTTTYLNADGFYSLNGNGSITRPFNNRKYTVSLSMSANYNNNISYTDNLRNTGNNWNLRPGTSFRIDLENIVDASVNVNYTIYQTTTKYPTFTNKTKAKTLSIGVNGKNYFFKDLTLGYDFSKIINYGFSSSVNSNPVVMNVFAEYRFLKGKMATIKLQGYDLFNQNTGINRTIDETTITDSRTNRLARYFLLSFNIRMQKFNKGGGQRMNGFDRMNRGGGNGGGNRGGGGRSQRSQ